MRDEFDPAELVGSVADERLLAEDTENLPGAVGRPDPLPPTRARGRLVAVGATLTGTTLLLGVVLIALGAIIAVASGFGVLNVSALALGLALVATHWGWVHVAEATADALEQRSNREALGQRRMWLQTIKPYVRYEVSTSVGDDGSIRIVRVRHRPVRTGENTFTFVREVVDEEIRSGDEPSATVAERAELLRRHAAADTERHRQRYELVADTYESALLDRHDEQQQVEARRAASKALSEQINSNLRDPPLVE